jgi:hypothetical protein
MQQDRWSGSTCMHPPWRAVLGSCTCLCVTLMQGAFAIASTRFSGVYRRLKCSLPDEQFVVDEEDASGLYEVVQGMIIGNLT